MARYVATLVAVLGFASPALGLDITTCGTVVPQKKVGVLQADLDCGGLNGVILRKRATLDMNGHSISNAHNGVLCDAEGKNTRCTILGPGTIDSSDFGIQSLEKARVEISDVSVSGCGEGIHSDSYRMKLTATNVQSNDNLGAGIRAGGPSRRLINVVANGNGNVGIYVFGGKATNVTANDNLWGLIAFKRGFQGRDITTNNNAETGVRLSGSARISGLQSHGNGRGGIMSFEKRLRLDDASLSGNTYMGTPADIVSTRLPKVGNVTCGYSWGIEDVQDPLLEPWGICAND